MDFSDTQVSCVEVKIFGIILRVQIHFDNILHILKLVQGNATK
jgi:hypothetical protein